MEPEIDTGTEELLARFEDGVATLTLNRPQARNALSDTLSPALRDLLERLAGEPALRCVLVTGAGTAFCAGGDVKGMGAARTPRPQLPDLEAVIEDQRVRQQRLTGALAALPVPTLAALPGPAAGAGLSIALACDLRIAAASAFVTTGFANVGLAGDYGTTWFLPRLVGLARAKELMFSAERVDAATCLRLGIFQRVVPDAELADAARAWARELAAGPTRAYAWMKRNLDASLASDLPAQLAREAEATVRSAGSEDHREAVRAFAERRKPEFRGR